jgi:cobalamin biosynthetic protein CobC
MAQALADQSWQQAARQRLAQQSDRLHQLLLDAGLPCSSGTLLFRYCQFSQAAVVADALAARGILVRAFNEPPALRFGLPGAESDWQKLQQGLLEVTKQIDHPHPG